MMTLMLDAAGRSLLLGVIVAVCLRVARIRSPHTQKTAWTTVLIAALAMPLLLLAPVGQTIHAFPSNSLIVLGSGAGTQGHIGSGWAEVGTVLWCLVAMALLWRYAMGLKRMGVIRRNARVLREEWTRGLDVRTSSDISVPVTFGSTVLLPADFARWSDRTLAAAISHERSHVLERDCRLLWLARLHTCVFWFNPLAWWLQRKLAALAETTSDDAAVATVGNRPAYAEILLEFAKGGPVGNLVASVTSSGMANRIEHVISETTPPAAPRLLHRAAAVFLLLPIVAAAAIPLQASPLKVEQASSTASAQGVPHITNPGGLADLEKYYPAEAMQQGIEGTVAIAVTLDPQGRATDTLILSEDPPGVGFGAAASTAAHSMEYSNPTGRSVQFTFRVKFALTSDQAPSSQVPAADTTAKSPSG
jgi:TonB family protein